MTVFHYATDASACGLQAQLAAYLALIADCTQSVALDALAGETATITYPQLDSFADLFCRRVAQIAVIMSDTHTDDDVLALLSPMQDCTRQALSLCQAICAGAGCPGQKPCRCMQNIVSARFSNLFNCLHSMMTAFSGHLFNGDARPSPVVSGRVCDACHSLKSLPLSNADWAGAMLLSQTNIVKDAVRELKEKESDEGGPPLDFGMSDDDDDDDDPSVVSSARRAKHTWRLSS
mmetsp:Transcript_15199/g.38627  ORF Transcript_15199/g.38627 Transcript_15199/m.38627 type:complete len:234 (+) Transcript_15199:271-972(+)